MIAGPPVMLSSTHCRLGLGVHGRVEFRRGRNIAPVPSAASASCNMWARSAASNRKARAMAWRMDGLTPAKPPRSIFA